jgi:hypothetical protein
MDSIISRGTWIDRAADQTTTPPRREILRAPLTAATSSLAVRGDLPQVVASVTQPKIKASGP